MMLGKIKGERRESQAERWMGLTAMRMGTPLEDQKGQTEDRWPWKKVYLLWLLGVSDNLIAHYQSINETTELHTRKIELLEQSQSCTNFVLALPLFRLFKLYLYQS